MSISGSDVRILNELIFDAILKDMEFTDQEYALAHRLIDAGMIDSNVLDRMRVLYRNQEIIEELDDRSIHIEIIAGLFERASVSWVHEALYRAEPEIMHGAMRAFVQSLFDALGYTDSGDLGEAFTYIFDSLIKDVLEQESHRWEPR